MSVNVLFYLLLNGLGKTSIIYEFNNTGARLLDSIYQRKFFFGLENVKILLSFTHRYNGRHNVTFRKL